MPQLISYRSLSGSVWALGISAVLAVVLLYGGTPLVRLLQVVSDHSKALFGQSILITCSLFLLGLIVIALSPWGRLTLGHPDEKPEFSFFSWGAMLFAAGMGAGLVFWGVAEPVTHFWQPPLMHLTPGSRDSAAFAMAITFLHWTLHPWAIYATSALVVAFAAFRHNLPLLPSTPFRLIWPHARRRLRMLDTVAALGVLFGLAAGIAQGVYQMDAGLQALNATQGFPQSRVLLCLCLFLSLTYILSASGRLENSIRILSLVNIWLAAGLAAILLWLGPWDFISALTFEGLQQYATLLPHAAFDRLPGTSPQWSDTWTITYFLSWVSWVPFVSIFLARISRGRTVRSFILGVVLLPSLASVVWFGILGGNALFLEAAGISALKAQVAGNEAAALFLFLQHFPFAEGLSTLAILLIFIFLATSADSGSYVLAMLVSHETTPSTWLKVAWGVVLAILSLAFIWGGDSITAVRAMFTLGAMPVLAILLGQVGSLFLGRRLQLAHRREADDASTSPAPPLPEVAPQP